jgi:hypothetical protein
MNESALEVERSLRQIELHIPDKKPFNDFNNRASLNKSRDSQINMSMKHDRINNSVLQ